MYKYNPKDWLKLILFTQSGDTLHRMLPAFIYMILFTVGITWIESHYPQFFEDNKTIQIHSLLGFVIGLLLVFRTNTAYDRWWEGRKQWGALVNNSRNLAIKLQGILPKEDLENRTFFSDMISNYVFAMKEHLRSGVQDDEMIWNKEFTAEIKHQTDHVPNKIASLLFSRINQLYQQKVITGDQLFIINQEFKSFTDIIGACERIKNTPIPFCYSLFFKRVIIVYIATLPLGIVANFHIWTVPVSCFVLYVFSSLELLAEEIEEPFGKDLNDLPTDNLSSKIQSNVQEILLK